MPGPKPVPIVLSEKQRDFLNRAVRREKSTQQQVRRCSVVLLAADGSDNCSIATRLNLTLQTVRRWRLRWQQVKPAMLTAEENGDDKQLQQLIVEALSDEKRSGRPATFTPEQICQIVAMACEKPEDSQRPISHWTPREVAQELIKRGIVTSISPRTVGRFFKRCRS